MLVYTIGDLIAITLALLASLAVGVGLIVANVKNWWERRRS